MESHHCLRIFSPLYNNYLYDTPFSGSRSADWSYPAKKVDLLYADMQKRGRRRGTRTPDTLGVNEEL